MTKTKYLGIFMDHSTANLIELTPNPIEITKMASDFSHQDKEKTLSRSENIMHNKEQHKQTEFYKKLMEKIKNYEDVLIFGPTNAKTELHNLIKADHLFEKINIELRPSDKLNEHEQKEFVTDYFSKRK